MGQASTLPTELNPKPAFILLKYQQRREQTRSGYKINGLLSPLGLERPTFGCQPLKQSPLILGCCLESCVQSLSILRQDSSL